MGRLRKIHCSSIDIANEQNALTNLWRTIVHRVYLEYVEMISNVLQVRQIRSKQPDNGPRFFFWFERRATLVWSLGYRAVAQSSREKPTNILHEEKLWLHKFNKLQEIPNQRSSGVLNSSPPSRSAERLAGWSADDYVNIARVNPDMRKEVFWI